MTRKLVHILAGLSVFCGAPAAAVSAADGEWMTEGGWSKVRIGPCASDKTKLCGNLVWLKNANDKQGRPKLDKANPDPKLRTRPLVGLPFIYGFSARGQNRWTGGKIYDPQSGKTYSSKLSVNANGTLKVEGCVFVICRAQTWTRAR